ncbi:hypothetical protein X727_12385 [Mesorhizobium sp. L103C119B0]|nr:hypothetical protein X727_12385 [Mesorhizobium sp. L103C119B0]
MPAIPVIDVALSAVLLNAVALLNLAFQLIAVIQRDIEGASEPARNRSS